MKNCIDVRFKTDWRGHREGVATLLTPSRALELHKQKIVSITSTGQTVLADLGYVVPKAPRRRAKAEETPAPEPEPVVEQPETEPEPESPESPEPPEQKTFSTEQDE
jgi:hypothetical protein